MATREQALKLTSEIAHFSKLSDEHRRRRYAYAEKQVDVLLSRGIGDPESPEVKAMHESIERKVNAELGTTVEAICASMNRALATLMPIFPEHEDVIKACIKDHGGMLHNTWQSERGRQFVDRVYEILKREIAEEEDRTKIRERIRMAQEEKARQENERQEGICREQARQRSKVEVKEAERADSEAKKTKAIAKIDNLIGLERVKSEVRNLANFAAIEKERAEHGLIREMPALHMVFSGNPGTGKNTVGRILGKIFKDIGVTKSDKYLEVDQSALLAQYTGQTPAKTLEVCRSALGGILLIDEAYALVAGSHGSQDFGMEAINTLLKFMEDNRGNIIVIVAGYPEGMKKFLRSNVGLGSRFARTIHFEDYSNHELKLIARKEAADRGLRMEDDCEVPLENYVRNLQRGPDFANGREMRKYLERVLMEQANRLMRLPNRGPEDLKILARCDLENANQKIWKG